MVVGGSEELISAIVYPTPLSCATVGTRLIKHISYLTYTIGTCLSKQVDQGACRQGRLSVSAGSELSIVDEVGKLYGTAAELRWLGAAYRIANDAWSVKSLFTCNIRAVSIL